MSAKKTNSACRARLAPSPTGQLHVGNAWAFLIAWLACRLENGKIFLRMEDIDPQRSKKEFAKGIEEDLAWLGIDWDTFIDDKGSSHATLWQSERYTLYEKNLNILSPYTYKCYCTRKELREMAGAPQQKGKSHIPMPDIGAPYMGRCRNLSDLERAEKEKSTKNYCLRLACPQSCIEKQSTVQEYFTPPYQSRYSFQDYILGKQEFSLQECGGDFALKRSDGVWAYQLAVVSDDRDMGITQIVRGSDILMSTPRQLYLYDILGSEPPHYAHIPLLLDENGDRLAKRHKSLALASLREKESDPQKIVTYLANLMGFTGVFAHAHALLAHIQAHYLKKEYAHFPWEVLKHVNPRRCKRL